MGKLITLLLIVMLLVCHSSPRFTRFMTKTIQTKIQKHINLNFEKCLPNNIVLNVK